MDTCYLPEELTILILERLPPASAIRFRSVCKSWNCIISAPVFLQRSILLPCKRRETSLLIIDTRANDPSYTVLESPTSPWPTKLGPLPRRRFWIDSVVVVGSCKGVICLVDLHTRRCVLWNPTTGEARALPKNLEYDPCLGFGHHDGDFKVVKIYKSRIKYNEPAYVRAHIYELNLGSWREISPNGIDGHEIGLPWGDRIQGCWRDGKMCSWISRKFNSENRTTECIIVSFDMANETFTSFSSAPVSYPNYGENVGLLALYDYLALWFRHPPHQHSSEEIDLDIWVLFQHGVVESWTKVWTIRVGPKPQWPVELWNGGLIMTKRREDSLLWCDLSNSSCIIQTPPVFAFPIWSWAVTSKVAAFEKTRDSLEVATFVCFAQFKPDPRFEEARQLIRSGAFGSYDYDPLLDSLEGNSGFGRGDYYLVGYDFPSYLDAQEKVDEAYKDQKRWLKMSILSTVGSGKFSSDRRIAQYAKEIWNIDKCLVS